LNSVLANVHRNTRSTDAFSMSDFLLRWGEAEETTPLTDEEIAAKVMSVFSGLAK
jgi:hypothetical protein